MNKKFQKAISVVTVSSLLATNVVYATSPQVRKNETIYVTKDSGEIKDKTVSVWINSDNSLKIKDKSDLKDIKNLETDESITAKNGYIEWDSKDKDLYYQGTTDKDLPVDVNVKYFLDGKEVKFDDLKGKSGHLKIVEEATNKTSSISKIDGKNKKIYSPYVVLSEITFDDSQVKNIKAEDVKIVKDGKNQIVASVLTPGLKENFDGILDDDKLDKFKNKVEIEMDITDYEPTEIYTVITNEIFQDDKSLSSFDDLNNGINELTSNIDKLVDASSKLKDGSNELNNGIASLSDGANKLADGSSKLSSSFDEFSNAFSALPEKLAPIETAVEDLNNGSAQLNTGIEQYTLGVNKINNNLNSLNKGAEDLLNGATSLDDGIGKLNTATKTIKKEISSNSGNQDLEKLVSSLGNLKTGIDEFNSNITPMATSVNELNLGLENLKDSSAILNEKTTALSKITKSSPSIEGSTNDLITQAKAIEGIISNIENKDSESRYNDEINALKNIEKQLYKESENLKSNINTTAEIYNSLYELAEGTKQLSVGIAKVSSGTNELSTKLNESKDKLETASKTLSSGVSQIDNSVSDSSLAKLIESLEMLDDATIKLKDGSAKLKEGTIKNQEGVKALSDAMNQLDSKSDNLKNGSKKLSGGLSQFKEKSKSLTSLSNINEIAINPMKKGIGELNSGILELRDGANKLKEGSDTYNSKYQEFDNGLREYKTKGIDKLSDKTSDLTEIKEILDEMSKMSKENNSISGSTEGFETKSRIIEKIR